jgi:hypothetical protein
MKLVTIILSVVLGVMLVATALAAQDDQDNYFTGTLSEITPDHLKVSRVLQGKAEGRVFKVNAQTKIEGGRLRLRERVTVRFLTGDESDTAILVIVRPAAKNKK